MRLMELGNAFDATDTIVLDTRNLRGARPGKRRDGSKAIDARSEWPVPHGPRAGEPVRSISHKCPVDWLRANPARSPERLPLIASAPNGYCLRRKRRYCSRRQAATWAAFRFVNCRAGPSAFGKPAPIKNRLFNGGVAGTAHELKDHHVPSYASVKHCRSDAAGIVPHDAAQAVKRRAAFAQLPTHGLVLILAISLVLRAISSCSVSCHR